MKRLRQKIESVIFAGLKSDARRGQAVAAPAQSRLGRLRARIDEWINGGPAPSDPLYLTNRTTTQKLKAWSVVAVPVLILVGGVALTLSTIMSPPANKPSRDPSPAEVAASLLPNLKDLKLDVNHDIDVEEVRIEKGSSIRMVGTVKNRSDHQIAEADITCDLTDSAGTQLGSVVAHVENIPPSATRNFDLPLIQGSANFVLIREITTR